MTTRSQKKKQEDTAENEYLERKIAATVKRMREFGIHNCCKCRVELEHNHYAKKYSEKGIKYYCISCDTRRW